MRLIDADKMIADLKAMERVYDAIALDGMIRGRRRAMQNQSGSGMCGWRRL